MQAWVTHATGDLILRRIPVPEPLADELLVEVPACPKSTYTGLVS